MTGGLQHLDLLDAAVAAQRHHQPHAAEGVAVQRPAREMAGAGGFHLAAERLDIGGFVMGLGGHRGKPAHPGPFGVGLLLLVQARLQAGDLTAELVRVVLVRLAARVVLVAVLLLTGLVALAARPGDDDLLAGDGRRLARGGLLELHLAVVRVAEGGFLGGGQLAFVFFGAGAHLVRLGDEIRLLGGVVGAVRGQGHIQAVGHRAGLFRREADAEQQHAVYRQGEKQCEAKPVAGGYLRCCHGVVILVPAGRRTTVRRC